MRPLRRTRYENHSASACQMPIAVIAGERSLSTRMGNLSSLNAVVLQHTYSLFTNKWKIYRILKCLKQNTSATERTYVYPSQSYVWLLLALKSIASWFVDREHTLSLLSAQP